MAVTVKTLAQTQYVTTFGSSAIYITPSGKTTIIKEIALCNVTAVPVTVQIDIVPTGFSPGNDIFINYLMAANETRILPCDLVMESLDELWGEVSTASSITVRLSGVEF